ncbi:MAG TPA: MazG nucleotide pyrophosphohydrolase domain-containing protein [bacterium]|nr:MazG nucleotide pyrophosphohydrolase domain-containing protein [bacterium]
MEIREFQEHIRGLYAGRDTTRGLDRTMLWLVEEIGELAEAVRQNDRVKLEEELADVVAWAASVANVTGLDLEAILRKKYGATCHYCRQNPCACTKG